MYEPTWESVGTHPLPAWYDDAKPGILLHWGLYSVPGWASQVGDIQQLLDDEGPVAMLRDNPCADWYLNTSRIGGSPTWQHQCDTYGPDATHDDFVGPFDAGTADADTDYTAATCRETGARYVVFTTKHHEGFCLWPTALEHPRKGRHHAQRDLVGDLGDAARGAGMRMGLFYSDDLWLEPTMHRGAVGDAVARTGGLMLSRLWSHVPDADNSLTFPATHHYDFRTPEYAGFASIRERKWESTRGVGHSFGANRNERPEDIVTATELVRSFADIVSTNGNLLIGIGPDQHGRFPDEQLVPLRGLGAWRATNGEAIVGTRPWLTAQATTTEGTDVRFTHRSGRAYALLLDRPTREFGVRGLDASALTHVRLLGVDQPLEWWVADSMLRLRLPERLPPSPVHVLALGQGARPAG